MSEESWFTLRAVDPDDLNRTWLLVPGMGKWEHQRYKMSCTVGFDATVRLTSIEGARRISKRRGVVDYLEAGRFIEIVELRRHWISEFKSTLVEVGVAERIGCPPLLNLALEAQ